MRAGLALALCVGVTVAVTGAQAAGLPARGTLYGVLTQGPIRPVCIAEESCDAPAPGVMLTFRRDGRVAGRVITARGGTYRIRLAAGAYAVRTSRRPFGTIPSPSIVRFVAGRARRVDFSIDTGIR